MELLLVVSLFLVLDVCALRWGADSRDLRAGARPPVSWIGTPKDHWRQ